MNNNDDDDDRTNWSTDLMNADYDINSGKNNI